MKCRNIIRRHSWSVLAIGMAIAGCQKMDRPVLGDYPQDANPPGGPLKFYVAFDGTTPDPLMNAVDSIRANFPSSNPLTQINGVSGEAIEGADQQAILYPSANDFAKSTSFSITFWEKNTPPTGGSPQFLFSLASKDYWHQSALFMLVDHTDAGSTPDSAATSFVIQDNWFVAHDAERLPHLLNGEWHHLAITYDQNTSQINYYVDGSKLTNVSEASRTWLTDNKPHGPTSFQNTYGFVVGGWNKHANLGNDAPTDAWIQSWQGGLDQFRLYNYALTDEEVQELYNSKL